MRIEYKTLVQPVVERAHHDPQHLTFTFIAEDGSQEKVRAAQFHAGAAAYARALQAIGIGSEDLVILVLRHSQVLLYAFWGALYRGAIPSIFPFLTEKLDPAIYMERVRLLVGYSGARAVITFPEFKDDLRTLLSEVDCQVLSTDQVFTGLEEKDVSFLWEHPHGEKIAFLQHSSGTTGLQKGVALSHRAVLNHVKACDQAIALGPKDVIVSWLPLYHDMGLIAGFVLPIVAGVPLVIMSPFHWVRDPKILLWAIHEHRGTLCWLPNFAFNHCVRSIRQRDLEGLDLSHWRAAINAAEPVRLDSFQMFLERFSAYGFQPSALAASYGMAENTCFITQTPVGQPPHVDWVHLQTLQEERRAVPMAPREPGSTPMVSCGFPMQGVEIAVVNDNDQALPERHAGEIITRTDFMLSGYYHRPDLDAQAIQDGWYYSGDIGYLADGQLYVSGRKKDLIIVGGKNIYPQDLESIANNVPGIHPGRAVAFGLVDEKLGSEVIVMVCEREDKSATGIEQERQVERELRRRVAQQTEITLTDVRLVGRKWVIKTSSGKMARADNRAKYLKEFRNHDPKNIDSSGDGG